MTNPESTDWNIYRGDGIQREEVKLPEPPPWRRFRDDETGNQERREQQGKNFNPPQEAIEMVNAALCLCRPLLVTGKPGTGKSSLGDFWQRVYPSL